MENGKVRLEWKSNQAMVPIWRISIDGWTRMWVASSFLILLKRSPVILIDFQMDWSPDFAGSIQAEPEQLQSIFHCCQVAILSALRQVNQLVRTSLDPRIYLKSYPFQIDRQYIAHNREFLARFCSKPDQSIPIPLTDPELAARAL